MKVLNVISRILGFLAAVVIMISVFITTIDIEKFNISMYSMSLFEYNRVGSAGIILFSALSLFCIYLNRGFLVSVFSLVILVLDFYAASTINTGMSEMDNTLNKLGFLLGDFFSPQAGFILILFGVIVLFFSGIIIRKSNEKLLAKQ